MAYPEHRLLAEAVTVGIVDSVHPLVEQVSPPMGCPTLRWGATGDFLSGGVRGRKGAQSVPLYPVAGRQLAPE